VLLLCCGGGSGRRLDVEMLLAGEASLPNYNNCLQLFWKSLRVCQREGGVVSFMESDIICSYSHSYQIFTISNIPISRRTLLPGALLARIVYMSIGQYVGKITSPKVLGLPWRRYLREHLMRVAFVPDRITVIVADKTPVFRSLSKLLSFLVR
jgi:hypothetical protein